MAQTPDEQIDDTPVADEMESSFLSYAMSVIVSRALPDVRDGLKPVHRRLLHSMQDLNLPPTGSFVKSARVVGDCFVEGTLVATPTGLRPIETIDVGDFVLDPRGKQIAVKTAFTNPASTVVDVQFADGRAMTVTPGQLFRVLNDDLSTDWVAARDLAGRTVLAVGGTGMPTYQPHEADSGRAYVAGLLSAEGWQVDRNRTADDRTALAMTDPEPIDFAAAWARNAGLFSGRSVRQPAADTENLPQHVLRLRRDPLLLAATAHTCVDKRVPSAVLEDRTAYLPYLAGYFDGDGFIRRDGRREFIFVSAGRLLLRDVATMLSDLGIPSTLRLAREDEDGVCWALDVRGRFAVRLAELLAPLVQTPRKRDRLIEVAQGAARTCRSDAEQIPCGPIFAELTRHHLGAGWYLDTEGRKFRAGLTYSGGTTKLRYHKNLAASVLSVPAVVDGGILDKLRRIGSPIGEQLADLVDHFTQRTVTAVVPRPEPRVTYDIEVDTDEHAFVADGFYVHNCIGRFHPHGDSAVYEALVRMAQDFSMGVPLVDGHGNFGTHSDPAAAMRYCVVGDTRVRLADGSWTQIADLAHTTATGPTDRGNDGATVPVDVNVAGKRGEPVHASAWFDSGVHPVRTVTTVDGHTLTGSTNHPILVLTAPGGVPLPVWKTLAEVRPGDVAILHRATPTAATRAATADQIREAVLSGVFTTIGYRTLSMVGVESHDAATTSTVTDLLRGHGITPRVRRRGDTSAAAHVTGWHLVIDDPSRRGQVPAFLDGVATAPGARRIPDWVWAAGVDVQEAYLAGVNLVAGTARRRGWRISVESAHLAADLATLLLGHDVAVRRVRDGRGGWWLIPATGADARHLNDLLARAAGAGAPRVSVPAPAGTGGPGPVPFVSRYLRRTRAEAKIRRTSTLGASTAGTDLLEEAAAVVEPLLRDGWHYAPVASVRDAGTARVYSVRVDTDDHAFLTDGFISHNTECRMSHAAMAMTSEIDENTVDMVPNYDGTLLQPSVLPAAFPNLLANGSEGIAVGMATKIPPHNLGEVVAACQHLLAHPDATVDDMIAKIPAPDLPTGGLLLDVGGAHEAYRTGKGAFRMRARTEIVGRDIVVTELPYQVGPEAVIAAIKKMRDAGKLDEVSSVVDLTDRNSGLRLVITAKRTAAGVPVNPEAVLRKLFKYTPLELSFAIHNLALVDGSPRTLNLLQMVSHYVEHRLTVTRRRCEYRKAKAEARAHLLEGYLVALAAIDEVVAIIRASREVDTARKKLMKQFVLSEIQASSILEMPLRRLTGLEVKKIKDELAELRKKIAELTRYLTDTKAMRTLVSDELGTAAEKFIVPRRSQVVSLDSADEPDDVADLAVPDVPCRIQLSTTGKLGRFGVEGHKGVRTKDDAVAAGIEISVRGLVGVITDTGRLLHLHPMDVPQCEGKNRGTQATEFIADLARDETVVAFTDAGPDGPTLALVTAAGVVKKIAAKDFAKASGQPVIGFKADDDVVVAAVALPAGGEDTVDLVLVSAAGQLLRFSAGSVRAQGRSGSGVAGMKLADGDKVIAAAWVPAADTPDAAAAGDLVAVTVSDAGGTKYTPVDQYPSKGRGTGGVRCQRMGRGETTLVSAAVGPSEELMLVAGSGALGKLPAAPARRDAMGERLDATAVVHRRP